MLYLFVLSVGSIIIFAPLVFATSPVYDFYEQAPRLWNLSPLADQQIGAIIMKVGGGLLYLTLLILAFLRWFNREEAKRDRCLGVEPGQSK